MNVNDLKRELTSFTIPGDSGVTQANIDECLNFIKQIDFEAYKPVLLEWNERAYQVLNDHFLLRVKGEKVSMDVNQVFKDNLVEATPVHYVQLRGKFNPKTTAILIVIKNSINISAFLSNVASNCSVSYVEANKGKINRGFTTCSFNK